MFAVGLAPEIKLMYVCMYVCSMRSFAGLGEARDQ